MDSKHFGCFLLICVEQYSVKTLNLPARDIYKHITSIKFSNKNFAQRRIYMKSKVVCRNECISEMSTINVTLNNFEYIFSINIFSFLIIKCI